MKPKQSGFDLSDQNDESEVILEGTVERVTYANADTAWCVLRFLPDQAKEWVTIVGNLLTVSPGEYIRVRGIWQQHPQHGRQVSVQSYVPITPSTLDGIEKYLGSGLIPGIGKEMASRIVNQFGLQTLDVIGNDPDQLSTVDGIGSKRSAQIRAAWNEQKHIQDVMVFLQSHGISTRFATRIIKIYGDRAMARVRDNPYCLAQDLTGIGFRKADVIAKSLGFEGDSPVRVRAALHHVLQGDSDDGHVYARRLELVQKTADLLNVAVEPVHVQLEQLVENGGVVSVPIDGGEESGIYLDALYRAELTAARRLLAIHKGEARPLQVDVPRAIQWFEERQGLILADKQRRALELAVSSKVMVITGGPGTGKTTVLNAILQVLEKKGLRHQLAAPTGRAAKRMQQATGRRAQTIHRLLEFQPRGGFLRDRENPLASDLFVVDEMSMVDTVLSQHLLRAIPDEARVILVGDIDQLPAVGPGNVLRDLIESNVFPVVTLDQIYRQEHASDIVVNAHRVNHGEVPVPGKSAGEGGDFYVIHREEPEQILDVLKEMVMRRIPNRFGLEPAIDIQVLTPMQRGVLGVQSVNRELQELVNPEGRALLRGDRVFRVGDRVMQIRNNYDLDVFNGDVGVIAGVDPEKRMIAVNFDGRVVDLESANHDDLVLAYASSIHKSQGSEYPAVVIPLHTSHYVLLQRNLLYTAITRGKSLVVLIGSPRAIGRAVHNNPIVERNTRLAELLQS